MNIKILVKLLFIEEFIQEKYSQMISISLRPRLVQFTLIVSYT